MTTNPPPDDESMTPDEEHEHYARPENQKPQGPPRRRVAKRHEIDPKHKPHPLSAYVSGTLTIAWVGGGEYARRATQREAHRMEVIQSGDDTGNPAEWHGHGWTLWHSERVGAVTWAADPWSGMTFTEDERRQQREAGHHDGFLRSLVDHWAGMPEPEFSQQAVAFLGALAMHLGPRDLGSYSELLTGETSDRQFEFLSGVLFEKPLDDGDEPEDEGKDDE